MIRSLKGGQMQKENNAKSPSRLTKWRERIRRLRAQWRTWLVFGLGIIAALCIVFVYDTLRPGQPRLTPRDVNQLIAEAIAPPGVAVAEGDAVADREPGERHDAGDGEALHQHRERVFHAYQPRVEESEAGQRHEEHQHGGGQHPCSVGRIELRSEERRVGKECRSRWS